MVLIEVSGKLKKMMFKGMLSIALLNTKESFSIIEKNCTTNEGNLH